MSEVETQNSRKINFYCDKGTLVIIDRLARHRGTTRSAIIRATLNEKFLLSDGDIPIEVRHEALEHKVEQLQRIVAVLVKEVKELTEK